MRHYKILLPIYISFVLMYKGSGQTVENQTTLYITPSVHEQYGHFIIFDRPQKKVSIFIFSTRIYKSFSYLTQSNFIMIFILFYYSLLYVKSKNHHFIVQYKLIQHYTTIILYPSIYL